jgi:histidinol dehydrogenase
MSKPKGGKINEYLLFIADYLKIDKIYKISGAQGIAAVAYGTDRVKKVDAIMGPGNNYTQMAKKLLFGTLRIDSIAGPSEIVVIADGDANPTFVAADLLSQAEHGTGFEASTAFCLSYEKAEEIQKEVIRLVKENGLDSTKKALDNYGDVFVVDSLDVAIEATNQIAPEHVEVLVNDVDSVVDRITNAGTVFVGEYSPEPVGDYFCGTNHVLPTCGTARFSSGLSVQDFVRGYSVIRYTKEALSKNAVHIKQLAGPEGMKAHSLSVEVREDEIVESR